MTPDQKIRQAQNRLEFHEGIDGALSLESPLREKNNRAIARWRRKLDEAKAERDQKRR